MTILIKGGTVVTADQSYRADVLVADGKIAAIGETRPRCIIGSTLCRSPGCGRRIGSRQWVRRSHGREDRD